jgi:hypothetical protein
MKDDLLKGLYYLQDLPIDKFSEELLERFKKNLLPRIIGYVQSTKEPDPDVYETAKQIFG